MSYGNITVTVQCKIQLVEITVFTEATVVKTTEVAASVASNVAMAMVPSSVLTIQAFAHSRHWPKTAAWGSCAPFKGGAGTPRNTTSHGPRPTSVPSGILVHPAV